MRVGRINYRNDFFNIENEIDKLFEDFERSFGAGSVRNRIKENTFWIPAADIYEDTKSFKFKLDLPGVEKDNVKIKYVNNKLTVSGIRMQEKEDDNCKYHHVERNYGNFNREFIVPENVVEDKINALFDKGQLIITIPKSKELYAENSKIISIK